MRKIRLLFFDARGLLWTKDQLHVAVTVLEATKDPLIKAKLLFFLYVCQSCKPFSAYLWNCITNDAFLLWWSSRCYQNSNGKNCFIICAAWIKSHKFFVQSRFNKRGQSGEKIWRRFRCDKWDKWFTEERYCHERIF